MSLEDQNASFGQLRSLLNQPALSAQDRGALWALSERAYARWPEHYVETWLPYLESFPEHMERGILRWFEFSGEILWDASQAPDIPASIQILERRFEELDRARALFPRAHFGVSFPAQSVGEGAHEDPEELMPLLSARELWGLDISHNPGAHLWMMRTGCALPNLKCLILDGCEVEDRDILALIESEFFGASALKFLSIEYPWMTMPGFRALAAASCLEHLDVLRVEVHEQELSFEQMAQLFEDSPCFHGVLEEPSFKSPARGPYDAPFDEVFYQSARHAHEPGE